MNYKYLASILFIVGITSLSYGQTEVKPEFKKVERTNVQKKAAKPISKVPDNILKNEEGEKCHLAKLDLLSQLVKLALNHQSQKENI